MDTKLLNPDKLTQSNDFSFKNWRFSSTKRIAILSMTDIEEMIAELNKSSDNAENSSKKITTIPHASFNGELLLSFKGKSVISFNLRDVLEHAKFEKIENFKKSIEDSKNYVIPKKFSNLGAVGECALLPFLAPLKIKSKWNEEKMMKKISWGGGIEEIGNHQENMDWTFTTVYDGTINPKKEWKNVEIIPTSNPAEGINYVNLSKKENIEFFDEILFFEDELDDFGFSICNLKIRVMNSCFFILLRFFLRVNSVAFRVIDNRFYHEFSKNESQISENAGISFVRETSCKEISCDMLKELFPGVNPNTADPNELHAVDNCVKFVQKIKLSN